MEQAPRGDGNGDVPPPAAALPTARLAAELRAEIEDHLRANPVRHGEVFRDLERGLTAEQMSTGRSNVRNFINSVEAMLTGTLPTTKSAAMVNSYGYRYLLGRDLSPELKSHTRKFLRQLAAINPEITVDEPLRITALPREVSWPWRDGGTTDTVCPKCYLVHAGECDSD